MTPGDEPGWRPALAEFLRQSRFAEAGAVMTDLDGTAVHERDGRGWISQPVERGLARMNEIGIPVVVNSLRFPLSVIRVFGAEWLRITGDAIPLVTLKGSQVGRLVADSNGALAFDEIAAETLTELEVDEILQGVHGLVDDGIDLLVFFYPRDWREGEIIWTANDGRVAGVSAKYRSAAEVFTGPVAKLRERLLAAPTCMVFLLVDAPDDRLMAYQHTRRTSFFTHRGIDKQDGARTVAAALGFSLEDSIGAGDAAPDTFLREVGLAAIVGNASLDYEGRLGTVRLAGPDELGDMLAAVDVATRRQRSA